MDTDFGYKSVEEILGTIDMFKSLVKVSSGGRGKNGRFKYDKGLAHARSTIESYGVGVSGHYNRKVKVTVIPDLATSEGNVKGTVVVRYTPFVTYLEANRGKQKVVTQDGKKAASTVPKSDPDEEEEVDLTQAAEEIPQEDSEEGSSLLTKWMEEMKI